MPGPTSTGGIGTHTSSIASSGEGSVPSPAATDVALSPPTPLGVAAFEGLSTVIWGGDASRGRLREETGELLRRAREYVREGFDASKVTVGKEPPPGMLQKLVDGALTRAHREMAAAHGGVIGVRVKEVAGPFREYVAGHASELGLIGSKEVTAGRAQGGGRGRVIRPELVASRVVRAWEKLREIGEFGRRVSLPAEMTTEEMRLRSELEQWGEDEVAATAKLHRLDSRTEALAAIDEVGMLHAQAELHVAEVTQSFDDAAVDQVVARLESPMQQWRAAEESAPATDHLRSALRNYVALWIAEPGGMDTQRLMYSERALRLSLVRTARAVDDVATMEALRHLVPQLVSLLVHEESRRGRQALGTTGATDVPLRRVATIQSPIDLNRAMGDELYGALLSFVDEVRRGGHGASPFPEEREVQAHRVLELATHYVHFATARSDEPFAERARQGFDPQVFQTIMMHVGNGSRFDASVIALFRIFFSAQISANVPAVIQSQIPERSEGASDDPRLHRAERMGGRPLPYDEGMGMREFLANLPGMDADRLADFQATTGISYASVQEWGSVRANPAALSEKHWEAMVAFAEEEDERNGGHDHLQALLMRHRPGTIDDDALWNREIDEAISESRLHALAVAQTTRPRKLTPKQWDDYVAALATADHLEDVSVEPQKGNARDAILGTYHYIRGVAREHGRDVDVMDFLAAISPIARRLRRQAREGEIAIVQPQFMRNLPPHHWGYATFAEQIVGSKLATDVLRSTLETHRRGEVELPPPWQVRRYTRPLAISSGGGERQARALEEFAWLMRMAFVIDNALPMFDSNASLVTRPSSEAVSRYRLQLVDDDAAYVEGGEDEARAQLFAEVRNGTIQRELDATRRYLQGLAAVPGGIEISGREGAVALAELLTEYRELERHHVIASASLADRSPLAAYRSEEQRAALEQFYRGVRRFMRRVTAELQYRGRLETPQGEIRFQTIPHLAGNAVVLMGGERTTIALDDIARIAAQEVWSPVRTDEVMRLRIVLSHLRATGETFDETVEFLHSGVLPWWTGEAPSDQALHDLLRLDAKLIENLARLPTVRPTGGRNVAQQIGPMLPARLSPEGWRGAFQMFAERSPHGLSADQVSRSIAAIERYFEAFRGFAAYAWPRTLRRSIDDVARDPAEAHLLTAAIADFLPTIGVRVTPPPERSFDQQQGVERQLATWAVEDYVALFPPEIQVPVNPRLLNAFVALHMSEHRAASLNRTTVVATARQLLGEHNDLHDPAPWENGIASLPTSGLLGDRLDRIVEGWTPRSRRAYFQLLPRLRRQKLITRDDVEAALAQVHGGAPVDKDEVDVLEKCVGAMAHDLSRIAAGALGMVRSSVTTSGGDTPPPGLTAGFPHPVTDSGPPRSPSGDVSDELMLAYAVSRLTESLPVNLEAMSIDLVDQALAPYEDVVSWMARSYRYDLAERLSETEAALFARVDAAREMLELIASDADNPPSSYDAFLQQTAETLGAESFTALIDAERDLQLIGELRGSSIPETSLSARSRELYETQIIPHQQAIVRTNAERARALTDLAKRVALVQRRSVDLAAGFVDYPTADRLDRVAVDRALENIRRGLEVWNSLHREVADVQRASAPLASSQTSTSLTTQSEAIAEQLARTREVIESRQQEIQEQSELLQSEAQAVALIKQMEERVHALQRLSERLTEREQTYTDGRRTIRRFFAGAPREGAVAIELFTATVEQNNSHEDLVASSLASLHAISADIDRLRDGGEGTPSLVDLLTQSERLGSAGRASTRLRKVTSALRKMPGLLEHLEQRGNRLVRDIGTTRSQLLAQITQLEERLAPAKTWVIPEIAPLPAAERVEEEGKTIAFSEVLSTEPYHQKVQSRLEPILNGTHTLYTAAGNFLLSADQVEQFRTWTRQGRTTDISITDLFGLPVELQAHSFGCRLVDHRQHANGNPYRRLHDRLRALTETPSPEAELLYRLATREAVRGSGAVAMLLRDLLATLARAEGDDVSPASTLALLRRWALAHRDALAALDSSLRKLFVEVKPKASVPPPPAPTARDPRRLGPGRPIYKPEEFPQSRRDNVRLTTQHLLDHPERQIVTAIGVQRFSGVLVDTEEFRDFRAGRGDVLQTYAANGEKLERIKRQDLTVDIQVAERDFESPRQVRFLELRYEMAIDDDLAELTWLSSQRDFTPWVIDLLAPIARTPPGREPPLSLDDAQEIAVSVWKNREELQWLFVEPDGDLVRRFPEIGLVGVHAKYETLKIMEKSGGGQEKTIRKMSQFAGLTAILTLAAEVFPEIDEAWNAYSQASLERMRRAGTTDYRPMLAKLLISFYTEHRTRMLEALEKEKKPRMTYARYFTGFDRPWDVTDAHSWEAFDPIDRLRMTVPEAFAVHDELLGENIRIHREVMLESMNQEQPEPSTPLMQAYSDLAAQSPELRGLILLDELMMSERAPYSRELVDKDLTLALEELYLERAVAMQVEPKGWLRRFAEIHASPRYLSILRRMLQRTFAAGRNEQASFLQKHFHFQPSATFAEALTGRRKPWLPEIAAPAPPPAKPMYGPEEHRHIAEEVAERIRRGGAAQPSIAVGDRAVYLVHSDPTLIRLGEGTAHAFRAFAESSADAFDGFVVRLVAPFAHRAPFAPHQAQQMMLEWRARHDADPAHYAVGRHPLFTISDSFFTDVFPEAHEVGTWQIDQVMRDLDEHPIEGVPSLRKRFDQFPEFAGALTILAVVADEFPQPVKDDFAALTLDDESDDFNDDARMKFRGFYTRHAEAIRRVLGEESSPGMTRARWLTGRDEPWKLLPATWEEMDAEERALLQSRELPEPFPPNIWSNPEALLPTSDLARIDEMSEAEINERIDALGLSPATPMALARMKTEMVRSYRNGPSHPWGVGEGAQAIADDLETAPLTYLKMFSIVDAIVIRSNDDPAINQAAAYAWGETKSGSKLYTQPELRSAYRFLVEHRDEIIAHAIRVRDAKAPPQRQMGDVPSPIYGDQYNAESHRKIGEALAQKLKDPTSNAYTSPSSLRIVQTTYRVQTDPERLALGWLWSHSILRSHMDETLHNFIDSLYLPLAVDLLDRPPAYNFREAEALAVEIFRAYQAGKITERDPLLASSDEELGKAFSETQKVGHWQLHQIMRELEADPALVPGIVKLMRSQPAFAGALAVLAMVQDALPADFRKLLLESIYEGPPAAEDYDVKDDARRVIAGIFEKYSELIREALAQELVPGMSRARWLTGIDNPWDSFPESWDQVEPLTRLKLMMPEVERIKSDVFAFNLEMLRSWKTREVTTTADRINKAFVREKLAFFEAFPENPMQSAGVVTSNMLMSNEAWGDALKIYPEFATVQKRGETIDRTVWKKRFVDAHTHPSFLAAMRTHLTTRLDANEDESALARQLGVPENQTKAHYLTGTNTPWLPEPRNEPTPDQVATMLAAVKDVLRGKGTAQGGGVAEGTSGTPSSPGTITIGTSNLLGMPPTDQKEPGSYWSTGWHHSVATSLPPAMPTMPALTSGMMQMPTLFRPMGKF